MMCKSILTGSGMVVKYLFCAGGQDRLPEDFSSMGEREAHRKARGLKTLCYGLLYYFKHTVWARIKNNSPWIIAKERNGLVLH